MGNPQPKVQDWEVGYLAGFIDGEGSIMINRHSKKKNKKVYLEVYVAIYGTDIPTKDKLTDILDRMGLPYHVGWDTRSGYQKRKCWRIKAVGHKRCVPWLTRLLPYLTTKRVRAELAWKYLRSRLSRTDRRNDDYTPEELEIVDEIRMANRGLGSETKRWEPGPFYPVKV